MAVESNAPIDAKDDKGPKGTYVLRNTAMYVEGVEYGDGDEIELPRKRGDALAEQGLVIAKGDVAKVDAAAGKAADEDAKAQADAAEAAAEAERVKLAAAEESRRDQIHAQPIRRGPGRSPKNRDQ